MAGCGKQKKYRTDKALSEAIEAYFRSISRTAVMREKVETGETDERGKPVLETVPIISDSGQPMSVTEYFVPPSVGALCLHLGISRQTWADYCDEFKNPQLFATTSRTRSRIECYLEQELVGRTRGGVQGIMFDLQNNYDWRGKHEVELGNRAYKAIGVSCMSLPEKIAILEEIASEFGVSDKRKDVERSAGGKA